MSTEKDENVSAANMALSGTSRRANRDQIIELFRFPGFARLAAAIEAAAPSKGKPGRRAHYSNRALLTAVASARVTGSTASALQELASGDLWEQCRAAYFKMTKEPLPERSPGRDAINHFREKVTTNPAVMHALREAFIDVAVGQAQRQGHLLPGSKPDWTKYDATRTVFGDGTILKPFSDVVATVDPVTGEPIALGSRAKSFATARIQPQTRRTSVDHKGLVGINFISLQTRTKHGRVVLGVQAELGAEQWSALALADSIAERAGDGFQALVYDRAITGWHVDYLMAHHRIQVLGKITGRSCDDGGKKSTGTHKVGERVAARAAELGLQVNKLNASALRSHVLQDMFTGDRLTRVGTCIYPKGEGLEVVNGYVDYLTATHTVRTGVECVHDLVVDDGALYTYEVDEDGELVKTENLRCSSATPVRTQAQTWGTRSAYSVPCVHGDFEYERVWLPAATRGSTPDELKDPIGNRLRPIPRVDHERFAAITRDRNDIESYNAWFKRSLPGKDRDRASALSTAAQEFDFLLGGVLANSQTWATYQGR